MEKFINSHVAYLKQSDFDLEEFKEKVQKAYEKIKKLTPVRLDASYLCALQDYTNEIINVLNLEQIEDTKEYKDSLLKKANLLQKEKNKTRYKKDKYKKSSFNEGY